VPWTKYIPVKWLEHIPIGEFTLHDFSDGALKPTHERSNFGRVLPFRCAYLYRFRCSIIAQRATCRTHWSRQLKNCGNRSKVRLYYNNSARFDFDGSTLPSAEDIGEWKRRLL
jgi:hypothetical protein